MIDVRAMGNLRVELYGPRCTTVRRPGQFDVSSGDGRAGVSVVVQEVDEA